MTSKNKRNNTKYILQFLLTTFDIRYTKYKLEESIENHVDHPSLFTVKEVLEEYGVRSVAIHKRSYSYDDFQTPFVCAIQHQEWDQPMFTVVTEATETEITYFEPASATIRKIPYPDFEGIDKNVVLLIDTEEGHDEVQLQENRKKEFIKRTYQRLPLYVVVLAIAIFIVNQFSVGFSWVPVTFLITTLIGLLISGVLIWHEIDTHDPFIKEVCGGKSKKLNCTAVLSSKGATFLGITWVVWGASFFTWLFLTQLLFSYDNIQQAYFPYFASLIVTPYIFYSVFYQWRVVKQWCPLCLGIQAVLLVNAIISSFYLTNHDGIFETNWQAAFAATIFAVLVLSLMYYAVPLIKQAREGQEYRKRWARIRYNPDVFNMLLKKGSILSSIPTDLGIVVGNPAAKSEIIKVCNPYCGPCSKAHPELEAIISKNSDVRLRIIFTAYGNKSEHLTAPARHLLAIHEKYNQETVKEALDNWYNDDEKDYEAFASRYPMNGELNKQSEKTNAMEKWCKEMKIRATPSLFIDGYELPQGYSISELKNFF